MKRLLVAVPLLVLLALIAVLGRGLSLDPREVDSPLIGKPAPAFTLPVLGGDQLATQALFEGEVSLLKVWASWCVACRAEHGILNALSQQPGMRIIGLNYKDEAGDAQRWLEQRGNPYVTSLRDYDGLVGIDWGVYGVPETFVIDRRGVIRAKRIGPLTWDYVNQDLLPLLQQLKAES